MNSIKIIANGVYLPDNEISNEALNEIYNLENNWIYKRTGIKKRWYETGNTIEKMAINAVENLINNNNLKIEELREINSKIEEGLKLFAEYYNCLWY